VIGLAAFSAPVLALIGRATAVAAGSIPYVGGAIRFLRSPMGRTVLAVAGVAAVFVYAHHKGEAEAKAACEAEALRARLAAVEIDLRAATDRAGRDALTIAWLRDAEAASRKRIESLEKELSERPLQSTKPGAKIDENAWLDDRCRFTPAGARRLRRE
jgi:hypothetical protein